MDAWQQLDEVVKANTVEFGVRTDITVTAHGCDRSVNPEWASHP